MKRYLCAILFFCLIAFYSTNSLALPFGDVDIVYWKNSKGEYTYVMEIKNTGPIVPGVTTPDNHTITNRQTSPPTQVPAGNKSLDDDENLVVFGLDTGRDDITISGIKTLNKGSKFHGTEEPGFGDNDNDGAPNQVIGWHLPFDNSWELSDTVKLGKTISVRFTLSKKVKDFTVWVAGSDDAYIWNAQHLMLEDKFGIYNADEGLYLASFLRRGVRANRLF